MKWFVAEHDSDRARLLRSRARNNNENLIAPSHMTAEVASAVYKRVQQGGLQTSEAVRIVGALEKVVIESVMPPGILGRAIEVASEFDLKWIYDAFYVALAEIVGCDLWTADEALHAAVRDTHPNVRLLTDYPLD